MKILKSIIIYFVLCINGISQVHAQKINDVKFNNFKFYTNKEGFYAEKANAIVQDSMGFLWIGTSDGLYKYDGDKFENFELLSQKIPLLKSNVLSIFKDSLNNLWIGTTNGCVHYNHLTGSFKYINLPTQPYITSITEDSKHNIWLATHSGLFIVNQKFKVLNSPLFKNSHYQGVFVSPNFQNTVFLASSNKLLIVNSETKAVKDSIVFSLNDEQSYDYSTIDSYNQIWIGKFNGELIKIDVKTKQKQVFDLKSQFNNLSAKVNSFFHVAKNKVWFCVDETGIVYYDNLTKTFSTFETKKQNHLPSYKIVSFFIDREENYWFGMDKNGLGMTNRYLNSFQYLENSPFGKNKIISSIFKDNKGNFWVGTDGGGIFLFDSNKKLIETFKNNPADNKSLANDAIHCIFQDSKNRIWIGMFKGGLNMYDANHHQFVRYQEKVGNKNWLLKSDVRKIQEDSKGNLWLVVQGKGVSCFNPETETFINYDNFPPHGLWTNDLLITKNNDIYVTSSSGIYLKKSNSQKFIQLDPDKKYLKEAFTNCLYEDRKGQIWIGTLHGLYRLNQQNNNFEKVLYSNLLSNASVRSINQDVLGKYIIATNKGLFKFDLNTQNVESFGLEDGLQGQDFIVNASYNDKEELYLGTSNGLVWFNTKKLNEQGNNTKIYITDIKVNNLSIQYDENYALNGNISLLNEIRLDYDQNFITVDFAYPSYIISKSDYQYKLEGLDNNWHLGDKQKSITLTSIPPGNYKLHIKVLNSSNHELVIDLVIRPPFYQTWWFRFVVLLIAIGLILFYLRQKTRSLIIMNKLLEEGIKVRTSEISLQNELLQGQRQELEIANQTKDKLFSIIAHDLKSPFTTILSMSEYMKSQFEENTKLAEITEGIYNASKNAYQILENLLHWAQFQTGKIKLKPQWININETLQSILESKKLACLEKNIELKLSLDNNISAFIDTMTFETIIRNLVNNAIKFSHNNSQIFIELYSKENGFVFRIEDKGIGMDESTLNEILNSKVSVSTKGTIGERGTGLGLMIVKEFIVANESNWEIISHKNIGTSVKIDFNVHVNLARTEEPSSTLVKTFETIKLNTNVPTVLDEKMLEFLKGKKLLIVDDQEDIRKSIILQLNDKIEIFEAENGKEALLIAKDILPDIIISDVVMPEMNGIELSKKIKSDIQTSHIPIILLTSQHEEKDVVLGLESGVDDYVLKPFNSSILILKIYNLLVNREKLKKKFSLGDETIFEELKENSIDKKLFLKIQDCINQNIANEDFSVELLSSEIGMHRSNLTKKITSLTGMTPNDLIKTQRMKLAAKLILVSGKNVSEVAYEVGFSDPKYFSKSFKKYFGVLPTEYKEAF